MAGERERGVAPTTGCCIEILLIKINKENGGTIRGCEFNENMRRVYNLETMLTEAYADDLTILFKWDKAGFLDYKLTLKKRS